MRIELNGPGLRRYREHLKDVLKSIVDEGIEEGRPYVHVDTGRLQKSLRQEGPEVNGKRITTLVVAGGIRLRGIYREQDIEKDVDYALTEEIRHPQIRAYTVPAILRVVRRVSQNI
jgi:hypothetical protein